MYNTNETYELLLRDILHRGTVEESRGLMYYEIPNNTVTFDLNYPFISHPMRKTSLKFAMTEALWMLKGENKVFHPNMQKYSDDGMTLAGAYGPKIKEQINYIVETLWCDKGSRQVVMTIWERNPKPSKDIPCTIGLQFRVRSDGKLHTTVYMRSSDAWLGIPYDLFSFSMITRSIAYRIGINRLGTITFMLGSSHIYLSDVDKIDFSADTVKPKRISNVSPEGLLEDSLATWPEWKEFIFEQEKT